MWVAVKCGEKVYFWIIYNKRKFTSKSKYDKNLRVECLFAFTILSLEHCADVQYRAVVFSRGWSIFSLFSALMTFVTYPKFRLSLSTIRRLYTQWLSLQPWLMPELSVIFGDFWFDTVLCGHYIIEYPIIWCTVLCRSRMKF